MPLANRVRPDGVLEADAARGMFTGNRGIIHDPGTRTPNGRRWTVKAWICCSLSWKGRKREVWGRNYVRRDGTMGPGWSELFFLDEVTALAAGHRPCHTCRRKEAASFKAAFCSAHGAIGTKDMDAILHGERWLSTRTRPQALSAIDLPGLPDGAMVEAGGAFFAMRNHQALPWSHAGYGAPQGLSLLARQPVRLVTPKSVLTVLRQGYLPAWHPSAA